MSKEILFIDDCLLKVLPIKYYLEEFKKFEIVLKDDIFSGLEYLKIRKEEVILVVIDMCVPYNSGDTNVPTMQGLKFIDELQGININIPIIVYSSTKVPKEYENLIFMQMDESNWHIKLNFLKSI